MGEAVHVERSVARGGMHRVIQRKLDEWEHGAPMIRRFSANAAEDVLHDTVYALCLTVGLRMIRRGHVQLGAERPEDSVPELPSEAGVSIRDNRPCWRNTRSINSLAVPSPSTVSGTAAR